MIVQTGMMIFIHRTIKLTGPKRPKENAMNNHTSSRLFRYAVQLLVLLLLSGCAMRGQKFYDQTTGRWYWKPEGVVFFNPLDGGEE